MPPNEKVRHFPINTDQLVQLPFDTFLTLTYLASSFSVLALLFVLSKSTPGEQRGAWAGQLERMPRHDQLIHNSGANCQYSEGKPRNKIASWGRLERAKWTKVGKLQAVNLSVITTAPRRYCVHDLQATYQIHNLEHNDDKCSQLAASLCNHNQINYVEKKIHRSVKHLEELRKARDKTSKC